MSAFYCNDSVIRKCVTAVLRYSDGHFGRFHRFNGNWHDGDTPIGGRGLNHHQAGSAIGEALRAMNVEALRQRYGSQLDPGETELTYDFAGHSDDHPAALFKALDCLGYQCMEGNVPTTNPLYAELDRLQSRMEQREGKLQGTPEYGRAPWSH